MRLIELVRSGGEPAAWYDRIAPIYERYVRWLPRGAVGRLVEELDPRPGETVLEIGPGPGTELVELCERVGPTGRVVGVDVSGEMIELARARLERRGFGDRATLIHGDARSLDHVADGTVDAIFAASVLESLPPDGRRAVLGECRRILAPDGRLGVLSLARSERLPARLYAGCRRLLPGAVDCRQIDLVAVLEAAGFAVRSRWSGRLVGVPVEGAVAVSVSDRRRGNDEGSTFMPLRVFES